MRKIYFVMIVLGIFLLGIGIFSSNSDKSLDGGEKNIEHDQREKSFDEISILTEAKAPEIVELENGARYELSATEVRKTINGQEFRMLAYNGSIPGPVLKVRQRSEILVNFTNNTDVATTIHSHGVRLENEFDGVVDVTQKAIAPGESFLYKIKFPDEGMYWYHPHFYEVYGQELGLYGNYWVVPETENYWNPVNRELPVFLDDILIENGQEVPVSKDYVTHTLMGRFGNIMLVNGETSYNLNVAQGEVIRFYFTNAANTRTFNVTIPGARMKLVGGDSGRYAEETFVESVILSPSERAIVEVFFPLSGSYLFTHETPDKTYQLGKITVSEVSVQESFEKEFLFLRATNYIEQAVGTPLAGFFEKQPDKNLKLSLAMQAPMNSMGNQGGQHMMHGGEMMEHSMMSMSAGEPIEWEDDMGMMNSNSTKETVEWKLIDEDTGLENAKIEWKFKVGDKVKIRIFNDPDSMHPMQHPIHFHGQRFLVLSENDTRNENLVWKDTVLVPAGSTMDILVDMSNPGTWMAHCHIAEHLEAGMMLPFEVAE